MEFEKEVILHPKVYAQIRIEQEKIIRAAQKTMGHAYNEALRYALPETLRPAVPSDIVIGAVLWYPDGPYWTVVDEVLRPDDDFKAYLCNGGRYGLYGAFVET